MKDLFPSTVPGINVLARDPQDTFERVHDRKREVKSHLQGGARNVIPLIVHVTHFYYYKNI